MLELQKLAEMFFVGHVAITIRKFEFLRLRLFLDAWTLAAMVVKAHYIIQDTAD